MSVLIRDMEMPKSCADCRLMADGWCYSVGFEQREKISTVKRPTWCPLVPVPPHGRMIDADALIEWLYSDEPNALKAPFRLCTADRSVVIFLLKDAPTIIPADPAEEGE